MSYDSQTLGDLVLLENTASRLLRVRDDLEHLGREGYATAADALLSLVAGEAAELRAAMQAINDAFSEAQ